MDRRDEIEIRSRFDGTWVGGYELYDADPDDGRPRFRVRRRADGRVLPAWFGAEELRPPADAREAVELMERRFLLDPHTPMPPAGEG